MKTWKIGVGAALAFVFLAAPRETVGALGIMVLWSWLTYYGYKGSAKMPPLNTPVLAFFGAVLAQTFMYLLLGAPDGRSDLVFYSR